MREILASSALYEVHQERNCRANSVFQLDPVEYRQSTGIFRFDLGERALIGNNLRQTAANHPNLRQPASQTSEAGLHSTSGNRGEH